MKHANSELNGIEGFCILTTFRQGDLTFIRLNKTERIFIRVLFRRRFRPNS